MIELAEATLTQCPAELFAQKCPMPTQDCIEYADERGRLVECWRTVAFSEESLRVITARPTQRGE